VFIGPSLALRVDVAAQKFMGEGSDVTQVVSCQGS
jgi:hypothetical protein